MRVLADGAWVNSAEVEVTARMVSPMHTAHLQLQIELRPSGQPFRGRPTATGAVAAYHGTAVAGIIHVTGLRDGVAYHWQARVHDTRGVDSPWTAPGHAGDVDLRVHLAAPSAPQVTLLTPSQPGGWVATRRLELRWSAPSDVTGIRGYSYALSHNPLTRPLTHLGTRLGGVEITAPADGTWYVAVRALNYAHSWGPPAHIAVRIDTATPRLRLLSAPPTRAINPTRAGSLLRVATTRPSRVTVDVVASNGRAVYARQTALLAPGFRYAFAWDGRSAHGAPIPNGHYTLRATATNRAGLTWSVARPLYLEDVAPALQSDGLSQTGTYNPYNNGIDGPETITATLNEPAKVRIDLLHGDRVMRSWQLSEPRAGQVISATWDGTTPLGSNTPGGLYTFRATAVDEAGNQSTAQLGWVVLDHRRIVVSLDGQELWALDGDHVLLDTLVTTGGPELPTPTGDFQIIARFSPFTFVSPYPPSSPYWYPDSPVNFAMMFQSNGYYIHDAPWRSYYGPGSNAVDGTPGTNTTGTHGCVNVPYTPMAWLFNWATMGTPVQVRQHVTPNQWPALGS